MLSVTVITGCILPASLFPLLAPGCRRRLLAGWYMQKRIQSLCSDLLCLPACSLRLFSLSLGGVASDRYNRYKLLLLTQVASMVQAILMSLLIFFKHYTVWEIIGLSAILGTINAFDVPARQSLVYEMVEDKSDLPNALALNSSMVNLSRLIGPGIAGLGAGAIWRRYLFWYQCGQLHRRDRFVITDEVTRLHKKGQHKKRVWRIKRRLQLHPPKHQLSGL